MLRKTEPVLGTCEISRGAPHFPSSVRREEAWMEMEGRKEVVLLILVGCYPLNRPKPMNHVLLKFVSKLLLYTILHASGDTCVLDKLLS